MIHFDYQSLRDTEETFLDFFLFGVTRKPKHP